MKTTRRAWIGLGAAFVAGSTLSAFAAETHQHNHAAPAKPAEKGGEKGSGGEGGEAGSRGNTDLKPSIRFARDIAFIRGHLLVGDELIRQNRWPDALPHFLHPLEEIYGGIKNDLATYKVRPFEAALRALVQTVKAKKLDAYESALALVNEQLASADAGLHAVETDWPRFMVATALEVFKQSTSEYSEAIEKGRIEKAVEYQDARGFVWQGSAMIEGVAADLAAKDADGLAKLRGAIAELKKAWPTAVPPKKPVKDVGQVLADVARIELYAGNFV